MKKNEFHIFVQERVGAIIILLIIIPLCASSAAQDTTSRYAVDFDSLVANFEQGTTLRALKAELEESKASLARSKQAVQKISTEMASQMRR